MDGCYLLREIHPETHETWLCWNICHVLSDSGANLWIGKVFLLLLLDGIEGVPPWCHRTTLLEQLQWYLIAEKPQWSQT